MSHTFISEEDPKVENQNLKSIENHIRLKDRERHKAKLLEKIQGQKMDKDENKNGLDITTKT